MQSLKKFMMPIARKNIYAIYGLCDKLLLVSMNYT